MGMGRIILYILLVGWLTVDAVATQVLYRGERPVTEKQISRLAANRSSDAHLVDTVLTILSSEGYLDARAERSGDSLIIDSGARSRLARIVITGDSTFDIRIHDYFSRHNLESRIENQLRHFYDQGYHYASLQITGARRDGLSVQVDATLNHGPVVMVADVRYLGLERSRPEQIARLLPIRRGDTLTNEALRATEAAADRIGYVTFRPPIRVQPQPGYQAAVLELQFDEKKQFRIEGTGGYIPDNSTGLVWSLQMGFTNMFGDGRQARMLSERREKGRNSLALEYRQPLFLLGMGELTVSAATRDYRDQFYEFTASSQYSSNFRSGWEGTLGLAFKSVTPAEGQPSFRRYTATVTMSHGELLPRRNPIRGWSLAWSVAYAHRRYSGDSLTGDLRQQVLNDTRATVSLQAVQSVYRRVVMQLKTGYQGYRTTESLPPVSELYLVGGPGSLRGYRNEQFAAIHAATGSVEPRLRFDQGYLFIFYDGAYLNNRVHGNDNSTDTNEQYRYGYGFGLAVMEPGRVLRLSLGWNPELPFDQPRLLVEFTADI